MCVSHLSYFDHTMIRVIVTTPILKCDKADLFEDVHLKNWFLSFAAVVSLCTL